MAGFDDYQYYNCLKEQDSPFWQKSDQVLLGCEQEVNKIIPKPNSTPMEHTASTSQTNAHADQYGELSIMLISICAENLISHPFIVLRRQCQVNVSSYKYHLTPLTLIPAIIHIQNQQGIPAFWKGLGSVLTVRGLSLVAEDCISKFTPLPKEISPQCSLRKIGQHLLLKCASIAVVTPFYSASLVETVRSNIIDTCPGVLDVFKEGLWRLISFTQPQTGRLLPVWNLMVPSVIHGISKYIIGNVISTLTSRFLKLSYKRRGEKQGALPKDSSLNDAIVKLKSAIVGHMLSDIVLYPFETILHRCHLQGTRTIIDSLDIGNEVKPILTQYEGFFDCLATTIKTEGFSALFKGFGALCLQYVIYVTVINFAQVIIVEISNAFAPPVPVVKPQTNVSPLSPGVPYGQAHLGSSSLHNSPNNSSSKRHRNELHRGAGNQLQFESSSNLDWPDC